MLTHTMPGQVVISPSNILQTGLSFWNAKVLITAVNLDLFTILADGSRTGEEIKDILGLHERGLYDFLDALVAMRFLYREGNGKAGRYCNMLETDVFLDKNKPSYVGGILAMANNRLFSHWNNLEEGLRTGKPQNEVKANGKMVFDALYSNETLLKQFLAAMSSVQRANFATFAQQFDFAGYNTHCDIGGADGELSMQVATYRPALQTSTFDLPKATAIALQNLAEKGFGDKVHAVSGDFFSDELPKADVITMGNILHDWDLEQKKMLIRKAYDALPAGGAFVAIENVIDDARKENVFGLLMSLNMLIETYGGFDYTAADFTGWAKEAGFKHIKIMHLVGPSSAMIAYK